MTDQLIYRSSHPEVFCEKGVLKNVSKFRESYEPQACNFIKKETLTQVFPYEFSEIFKNTFFHRTPPVVAF